jgi:hypothetical protein
MMNDERRGSAVWGGLALFLWLAFMIGFYGLLVFYVPSYVKIYRESAMALPMPTALAIQTAQFFSSFVGLCIAVILLVFPGILYAIMPRSGGLAGFLGFLAFLALLACALLILSVRLPLQSEPAEIGRRAILIGHGIQETGLCPASGTRRRYRAIGQSDGVARRGILMGRLDGTA